jgi:hypothetical protein
MRPLALLLALGSISHAADEPKVLTKPEDPLKFLAGTWIETSVIYSGEDLVSPTGQSNHLTFDGKIFTECTPTGKEILKGEVKLVFAGKTTWQIDLPHKILVQGKFKVITVPAIVKPVGANGLQIAYFDPDLVPPGKRPTIFESTTTNGLVLLKLKRKPL